MNIKGTESEQNLKAALAGESMARNKYTFYAMAARKAGEDKVADALERMAKNEMMHAKFWFEALHGDTSDTLANLREAAQGELQEWHSMYPAFAAKQEKKAWKPSLSCLSMWQISSVTTSASLCRCALS